MSTYKFEVAAKNAIIKAIKERFGEEFRIQDISVVWMAHLLNNKKGVFVDNGKNQRLYEVTYNRERDEMYLDVYDKLENKVVKADEFEFEAVY